MAVSYDYSAMINYATSHWNSGDAAYPIYSEDCANFVSRALKSGGWTRDGIGYNYWTYAGSGRFAVKTAHSGHAFTVSADWFTYANITSHRTHSSVMQSTTVNGDQPVPVS